jgi:SEC-C motif-containing protein
VGFATAGHARDEAAVLGAGSGAAGGPARALMDGMPDDAAIACPCGGGQVYDDCCGRFHRGLASPPSAEALMRSRFSAFARADPGYLLRTWHPSTRPARLELDGRRWTRLVVLSTSAGNVFDPGGTVEFAAHYELAGRRGVQRENSTFVREQGSWFYLGAA